MHTYCSHEFKKMVTTISNAYRDHSFCIDVIPTSGNTIHETCKSCPIPSIYFSFQEFHSLPLSNAALYVRLVLCILLYFRVEMPDFISLCWVIQIFFPSLIFSLNKLYVYIWTMWIIYKKRFLWNKLTNLSLIHKK